jgi:hypothetical protein
MKSEIEDLRCPTCRQRNSRVRKHLLVDGETALVWYCNVPGCSNGPDVPRQAADFLGVHAAALLESLPCAPDSDAVLERVKQGGVPVPAAGRTCDEQGIEL